MKVRRFRRPQTDLERARVSLRDDIRSAETGRRGRALSQSMSPVIGRGECVAHRSMPQRNMRTDDRIPIVQDAAGCARQGKAGDGEVHEGRQRCDGRLKKTQRAPISGKRKGKLAPRANSSKVDQITSARREAHWPRSEVTSPRHQHSTREESAAAATDATGVRTTSQSCAAPNFQVNSHADPFPERNA